MARANRQKIESIHLKNLKFLNSVSFTAENSDLRSKNTYSCDISDVNNLAGPDPNEQENLLVLFLAKQVQLVLHKLT